MPARATFGRVGLRSPVLGTRRAAFDFCIRSAFVIRYAANIRQFFAEVRELSNRSTRAVRDIRAPE